MPKALMHRRALVATLAACSLVLDAAASSALAADAARVTIDNFAFVPAQIVVASGSRVTWLNHDDIPHTVTSRDEPRVLRSAPLDTDDSYAVTFEQPGTYHYFCAMHPHMQGTVVVR